MQAFILSQWHRVRREKRLTQRRQGAKKAQGMIKKDEALIKRRRRDMLVARIATPYFKTP